MLHQTQEIRTSSRLGMGSDFFFLSQVLWCDKQNERKETDRNHSDSYRKCFKIKILLRKSKAGTVEDLPHAIQYAFQAVTQIECVSWFRPHGYMLLL